MSDSEPLDLFLWIIWTNTKCTQSSINFLRKLLPPFALSKKWWSCHRCRNHFYPHLGNYWFQVWWANPSRFWLDQYLYQTWVWVEGRGCLLNQLPPAKINSGHVGFCLCRPWISLRCLPPFHPRTLPLLQFWWRYVYLLRKNFSKSSNTNKSLRYYFKEHLQLKL